MATQVYLSENSSSPDIGRRTPSAAKEPLRVLHVMSHLGVGGTEHGVLKLMNGLGDEQFEHRICVVRAMDTDFATRMKVVARTYSVGDAEPGFQFPLFRMARIMKDFRPHIVHTRNFGALEGIPAARAVGVPVAIHSEHGYELQVLSGLPLRRRVFCRAAYAMSDAVVAVSTDLQTYHSRQSWVPVGKIRVIYNGVDAVRFSPNAENGKQTRHVFGIPGNRIVIGSVGRLVPIKDHRTLLEAAESLVRQGRDIHVLIVGSGPELGTLQAYSAASPDLAGRVTFTGASDRVPELLNAMNVFVLPSISEGMSNTILEAMASGLPVVATRAGGNPELVDDGQTGWLFLPRDARTLTERLLHLTDDGARRNEFGLAARRRIVQHFSLTEMVRRYRDLYFELASRRGVWKEK